MRKSGFTMIELIFVIVILGILAAVAIPKLAATRTDAKAAALAQQISGATSEVPNYVTAHGGEVNATPLTKESQVLKQLVDQGKANEVSDTKVEIYGDGTTTCVTFETNSTDLKVYTNPDANGQICSGVKKMVKDANYTIAGSQVNF